MYKAALSNLHTHEATGSSPVVSAKNHRNRSIPAIFFHNLQLFWMLNFCRFSKTHTLAHTGKGTESTGPVFFQRICWLMMPPMAFRILSCVRRKASGLYMVPVLGDGNRYGLRGCFVCSSVDKSTACCGSANVRMEFLVFGGLTTSSPLMRFTCFVMESVQFSMSKSDQSFPCT